MRDNQDREMRELVYRLVAMAPEAPPFPEEPMPQIQTPAPAGLKRRFGPLPVAALAAGLVIGLVVPTILFKDDASNPPATQPPATTSTTLDPAAGAGLLWPQTSLEEVLQAQELADAGDPGYTWQVALEEWYQPAQRHPFRGEKGEFFARFLEEVLGWEAFHWDHHAFPDAEPGDTGIVFIRCSAGLMNPLYPTDPEGVGCAPTLDDLRYETVMIQVAQLADQGPSGIWVVTGWEMIAPWEQIAPPSEAEIAASLDAFFQARVDGQGAEAFAAVAADDPFAGERVDPEIPLLYATSTGAGYERSEFELIGGPVWPSGRVQVGIRSFAADDETVVEQVFWVERDEAGALRFVYDVQPTGPAGPLPATTENGTAVPVEYRFLEGELTYRAAHPFTPADYHLGTPDDANDAWDRGPNRTAIAGPSFLDRRALPLILLLADPRPVGVDCLEGLAPSDAATLARSVGSDPDFEATAPVEVTIGGIPAIQIDLLVKQNASWCWTDTLGVSHHVLFEDTPVADDQLVRLYLLDLPGSPARVLAIVIFNADLDQALEWAAPIVESIEFNAG